MAEHAFDDPHDYDDQLQQGIRLSGEDKTFFIDGRVAELRARLPDDVAPRRILDFGCGAGETTVRLAEAFPAATVVGTDPSTEVLAHATATRGDDRITFLPFDQVDEASIDLCYVNGVLHHVPVADRAAVVDGIRRRLRPGGLFAVFENNSWNPGARLVMRRIPFDRDAVMLSPRETGRLLQNADFDVVARRSLFWFPHPLRFLRPLEPALGRVPLGSQYLVLGRRSA